MRWLLMMITLVAAAQTRAVNDLSSPKSAAKSLFVAIQSGDTDAVKDALYQPDAQQAELMSARADLIVCGKKLGDAMHEKFGASGDVLGAGSLDSADLAKLDDATVEQSPDRAKLTVSGQPRPMSFRKQDGKWRLVISDITSASPESLAKQTLLVQMMADALRTAATEITAGAYKTPDAAKTVIEQRLHNVMLTFQRPSTTRSTTEPATTRGKE
jgi:hypothetical protein